MTTDKTHFNVYEIDGCEYCDTTLYEVHCFECRESFVVADEEDLLDRFACCPFCKREVF